MDGLEVLDKIREKNQKLKVLILSARDSVSDKVKGLDSRANDYLTKPFDFEELVLTALAFVVGKTTEFTLVLTIPQMFITLCLTVVLILIIGFISSFKLINIETAEALKK